MPVAGSSACSPRTFVGVALVAFAVAVPRKCSIECQATAMIVSVGLWPDDVGNTLPSVTRTLSSSCRRPEASVTDVFGSLPMRMVPMMWAPLGTVDSPGSAAGGLRGMKPEIKAPAALTMAASLGPMVAWDASSKLVGM